MESREELVQVDDPPGVDVPSPDPPTKKGQAWVQQARAGLRSHEGQRFSEKPTLRTEG